MKRKNRRKSCSREKKEKKEEKKKKINLIIKMEFLVYLSIKKCLWCHLLQGKE